MRTPENRRRTAVDVTDRWRLVVSILLLGLLTLAPPGDVAAGGKERKRLLEFAVEMAKQGNWREARFRWARAISLEGDDPFVLNNLAVASEALGESEEAKRYYDRAVALSSGNARIAENARRQADFLNSVSDGDVGESSPIPPASGREKPSRKEPKSIRIGISLPVPPRLEIGERHTVLVASFLTQETNLMDTNREITRYMRSKFRRTTPLEVLDVTPAPAVPEQRLDDLAANAEFWRRLGREHGADIIVSGAVYFSRRDASSFQEVDYVSPTTGQKIRGTRFVEQEQFTYEIDFLFLDGKTGELLYRDRLQRTALFRGLANDPLTAFFELSETIAGDVVSTLTTRTREDVRLIFRG